jgi:hypothetical protein
MVCFGFFPAMVCLFLYWGDSLGTAAAAATARLVVVVVVLRDTEHDTTTGAVGHTWWYPSRLIVVKGPCLPARAAILRPTRRMIFFEDFRRRHDGQINNTYSKNDFLRGFSSSS